MSFRTNRRDLLRAVGAGALLAPFLGRLAPRGYTARAAPSGMPKRLIVFWTANGTVPQNFWPSGGESSFTLNRIMKPLEPHKGDLTILKGVTFSGTGDHKTGAPFSTSGNPGVTTEGYAMGPSIDQAVAPATGKPSLVLCGQGKFGNRRGYVSFDQKGVWVPPTQDPKAAYEGVFGPISGAPAPSTPTAPSGMSAAEYDALVLDTVKGDLDELRERLPSAERVKIEDQITALAALRKNLATPGGGGVGVPAPVSCDKKDGTPYAAGGFDYPTRVKLHMDLIATAFACDARRTASLMVAPHGHDNCGFSFIGVGGEIHQSTAHAVPSDPNAAEKMTKIAEWEAKQLAYLIERLKAIPEGSGTVFDNTLILWTSECTHGNHGHTNIPVVLVGNAGGFFKKGRFVDGGVKYGDVLVSIANAMGHNVAKFGSSSNGPATMLHA
jgi:hypothetical protein